MLNQSQLASALTQAFLSFPPNGNVAAQLFAQAYFNYAQSAATLSGSTAAPTPAGYETLRSKLAQAMADPAFGLPVKMAAAWSDGVRDLWLLPPVNVVGAQSGVVTAFPGEGALRSGLTALFSNKVNTAPGCAQQLAAQLDQATRTVTATVAPPPSTLVTLV